MAAFTPRSGNGRYRRAKPWKARVRDNYIEYFLGYYRTKDEAVRREQEFKREVLGHGRS